MMKKIYLLFFLFVFCCQFSFSQNPLVKQWDQSFGVQALMFSLSCCKQGRRIYYWSWSLSGIGGDKTQATLGGRDYWIVKTDSLGNKQWDKDFGGTSDDYLNSLQQTSDGGYILGGQSFSGLGGDKTQALRGADDIWIVKLDSLGNKPMDKDFGGTGDNGVSSLQQTRDGGYILGGGSNSGIGGDKTQATRELVIIG